MDQKFEGTPEAEIRLEGQKVIRSDVKNDWASRLQWQIKRNGEVVATPAARGAMSYEHPDPTPGDYEVVLQMWKYINYKKNKDGEFVDSKYVDISNTIKFRV